MSLTTIETREEAGEAEHETEPRGSIATDPAFPRPAGRLRRSTGFAIKGFLGVALCSNQFFLFPVIAAGWLMRVMRRATIKQWSKLGAERSAGPDFEVLTTSRDSFREHRTWPNWFLAQELGAARREVSASDGTFFAKRRANTGLLFQSLWRNLKLGFQGVINTWIVTLPAGSLWVFSWYAGWNNSFHKGYEQAAIGPLTGVAGVALFIAAMMYVPMAQARQASAGNWRSFYDFRVVRRVAADQWFGCAALAGLFALFAVPISIFSAFPGFAEQNNPALLELDREGLLKYLRAYYFRLAIFGFPALLALRIFAARLYARGVARCLEKGRLHPEQFHGRELDTLRELGLTANRSADPNSAMAKAVGWTAGAGARTFARVAAVGLWFGFVAQIFIVEFVYARPMIGFLNHPLVQLPWFFYLPPGLGG